MNRSNRSRSIAGFTVIELIIAIAITAVVATAVYSATQAMVQTARRQERASAAAARITRAIEIIERDLHGWLPSKTAARLTRGADVASSFEFNTTADSLEAESNLIGRSSSVQYVVRKVLDRYELQRIETTATQAQTLVLLQSSVEPKFEFYKSKDWLSVWASIDPPRAVRLTIEQQSTIIKL